MSLRPGSAAILLGLALAAANPARAQTPGPHDPACPSGFFTTRAGNCWTVNPGSQWAYVHHGGWMIEEGCFSDSRFTRAQLLAALDAVRDKMDPHVRVSRGGCLSRYNPDWGAELLDFLWRERTVISCATNDPQNTDCAATTHEMWDIPNRSGPPTRVPYQVISIHSMTGCMEAGGPGLAGALFHETLHASRADNVPRAQHNLGYSVPQADFVQDVVFGAEFLCFFGVNRAQRRFVNALQWMETMRMEGHRGDESLCDPFPASFTDATYQPPGIREHGH